MEKKFEMRKKYVLLALRANGYSNNTAIADIIDNSLETDVNAKNINGNATLPRRVAFIFL